MTTRFRGALVVAGVLAIGGYAVVASPPEDETPSVKQVMGKLTKGPNSLTPVLGKELKENPPAWDKIQGQTKEFARFAEALGKNDPPKGDKTSWEKLTKAYADSAKALDQAAQDKDKDAALKAHGKLATACMACHRTHRPR